MRVPRLAIGGLVGTGLALLLGAPMGEALADLAQARSALLVLEAEHAAPAGGTLLPPGRSLKAASSADAAGQLAARVRASAARSGVLVEGLDARGGAAIARVGVRLSGSEAAVLGLADALEQGPLVTRWRSWRVEAAGDGVRLTGELVAPWG